MNIELEENIFFDTDIAVPLGIIINELVSNSLKHAFIGRDKGEIRIKLHREEKGEYKKEGCKGTIVTPVIVAIKSTLISLSSCIIWPRDYSFTLTILDNGVGIPENLDIEDLDSLGLQLITTLVNQLDGELELKRNNGTEFTIRFSIKETDKQIEPNK